MAGLRLNRVRVLRPGPLPAYQLITSLRQNEIYAAVEAAVPRGLETFIRDDIKSEMILAVLDGEIAVDEIRDFARAFVAEYFREFGGYSARSLD